MLTPEMLADLKNTPGVYSVLYSEDADRFLIKVGRSKNIKKRTLQYKGYMQSEHVNVIFVYYFDDTLYLEKEVHSIISKVGGVTRVDKTERFAFSRKIFTKIE
jgi:hypothetical protein